MKTCARLVFIALSFKEDTIVLKFPEQLHAQNRHSKLYTLMHRLQVIFEEKHCMFCSHLKQNSSESLGE